MINYIKGTLLQVTFVSAILLMTSCAKDQNGQKAEDTKVVAEDQNDTKFDSKEQESDAQFLVNAAAINLEEIRLGKLAQQKGKAAHVKELGKMMEDAHSRSQSDLVTLAKSKGITIPTAPTDSARDTFTRLNDKTGDDFDKAYANMVVSSHKQAVDTYEEASTDADDTDIKNWAKATLPDLMKHLDRSLESQKRFDNMYLEENK